MKVKAAALVKLSPPACTVTSALPGEPCGAVATIEVGLAVTTAAGSGPMKSCRPARSNPAPVIVTCVAGVPLAGDCAGATASIESSGS